MQEITLIRPDDWHIHLRDDDGLKRTVADAASQFARCIVMPNLVPPVTNTEQASQYRDRILAAKPDNTDFSPLMTLYLTDKTNADDIHDAKASGFVHAVKLYPAGATTNSDAGVTDIFAKADVFAAMEKVGMPLLIHGEVTDSDIDIFDREHEFIERTLKPITQQFPNLKVVFEHITTQQAVEFVETASENIAATITAHHLLYNRNDMLVGGIRPHYFCLPILKRNIHQTALRKAATSGSKKFFLGTDSAPHTTDKKENSCGCAGCYTAYAAIEMYAEVFEEEKALDKLEGFSSLFGPEFYNLPANTETITLVKQTWTAPKSFNFGDSSVTPLRANEEIQWQIKAG